MMDMYLSPHTLYVVFPMTASMYARLNVKRTHTRETRCSRFLNNAHLLYRKCLFIVRNKYSARTYRSEWKLHALPLPLYHALLTVHVSISLYTVHVSISLYTVHVSISMLYRKFIHSANSNTTILHFTVFHYCCVLFVYTYSSTLAHCTLVQIYKVASISPS